ncbi:junctional protein associated with coronary artery disease isoform X2 [Alosa sapidissima]|uniref:junctional protein associated with coronary artery disease isoform X2 n=1 Tax=Alosa sapidissima TaxID=34773 RepID=UPI001C08779D|nr:junctional protein associated with coronary artery disease isoform X2 [Alosa sapidissima]
MYSVEDLLISHGYKLPRKHSPPPAPRRAPGEGGPPYGYPSRSSSALGCLTSASGSNSSSQRDLAHSHGRSVLADPGFYDTHRGVYVQPHSSDRGIAYWKRRGQDFSALLDYADGRVPMGMQRAEGRGSLSARERELALQQWRLAAERRQHGEPGAERWAQQPHQHPQHQQQQYQQQQQEQRAQQPRRPRTAEGAVPPRTKAKSQSLPRMALPSPTPPPPHGGRSCLSAGPSSLQLHEGGVWMGNPASVGNAAVPQARARQSRPPRPPSYEVHQQTRASSDGPMSRAPSRQDYCPSEPPGYMPPPSYRRQPIMGGGHSYRELLAGYMYRNDPYQQGLPLSEGVQWYARQAGHSWPDHHADGRRSAPCRAVFPVYSDDGRGVVQYIPFDDPRVRHISASGLLTDADKIRNIQNEIPGITVSEQSPDDSAFLSPQESMDSADVTPPCHAQWPSYPDNLSSAPDLNRNPGDLNRNPADVTSDLPTFGGGKRQPVSSRQSSSSDQGFSETITQVKKFEPEVDSKKPARRRQKETMFCLVSVPIAPQVARDDPDQNNNNKAPSPTVMAVVTQPSNQSNPAGGQPVGGVPDPQHPAPSSPLGSLVSRRAPLRRELVDAWTLQARCQGQGSWPGDQYRNQHTQTGSPEITRVPPPSSSSSSQPAPEAPSSDSTTDSGLGTDCCPPYSLPMKGQRSISPSSTSAFSRTVQPNPSGAQPSPTRLRSPPTTPPAPQPSPRRNLPRPASAGGGGGGGGGGEVFGQFLLKPVGRRPWDAIEELESFNKESQKVQEPTTGHQNIPEPNHTGDVDDVDDNELVEEMSEHKDEVDMDISPVVDDWGLSELVPLYRRTRSSPCWPEDHTAGDRLGSEEPSPRQGSSGLVVQPLCSPNTVDRQDIPVPQESMLRDVGLTVYTPQPHKGAPEESFSTLMVTAETQPARAPQPDKPLSQGPPRAVELPNHDKREAAPNSERTHTSVTVRRQRFRFSSEGPTFLTESLTVFSPDGQGEEEDEVLEALLSKVKKRPPSEDLSPLYQVQSASGIPQNESIEERAARILGISVPAESLVSKGQRLEGTLACQNEVLALAELVLTNQSEEEVEEHLLLANAEKPDGVEIEEGSSEKEEAAGEREEEENGEQQGEVEEEEVEETAAVEETAVPRVEEAETNVREGEPAVCEWETSKGEPAVCEWETSKGEPAVCEWETTEGEPAVCEWETTEGEPAIAGETEEAGESTAIRGEETAASGEQPVEQSVSDDRGGVEEEEEEEEQAIGGGEVTREEVAASELEISGSVEGGGEAAESAEESLDEEVQQAIREALDEEVQQAIREALDEEVQQAIREALDEEVPEESREALDEEVQQASWRGELAEVQVEARPEVEEEVEAVSGSPDSYIAIATLEMPEILSIVEEDDEDEDAEFGLNSGRMDRRMDCPQGREEAMSYMPSYLTLGHAQRKREEEEEEVHVGMTETEEQEEEEQEEEEQEEEGMEDSRGAEEERQIREEGEEESASERGMDGRERPLSLRPEAEARRGEKRREEEVGEERSKPGRPVDESPCPGVRPTPLPRSTVVKREIHLPLEALEDPDTYPASDSYDPSRVERV